MVAGALPVRGCRAADSSVDSRLASPRVRGAIRSVEGAEADAGRGWRRERVTAGYLRSNGGTTKYYVNWSR